MSLQDFEVSSQSLHWSEPEVSGYNPYQVFVGLEELNNECFPADDCPIYADTDFVSVEPKITEEYNKKPNEAEATHIVVTEHVLNWSAENYLSEMEYQGNGWKNSQLQNQLNIESSNNQQLVELNLEGEVQQQLVEKLGMQYDHEGSTLKKQETNIQTEVRLPSLYDQELLQYRRKIEEACAKQNTEIGRFLSKKRCNQTKIVCKLLRHIVKVTQVSYSEQEHFFHENFQTRLSDMSQINDIRTLLADEKYGWFRNTLKTYLLSPQLLVPIISTLSRKDYVKYLLLYSLDVLDMMVDDPYRHYSTWIASREVAKGDYSELIDSILRGETLNLDYLRNYVTNVFEQKGRELLLNRKCSDTNNTCYFIVTFFIKFLRSAYEAQVSQQVKHEHVDSEETQMPSLQILEKSIETLERRKSFYSVKQLVNNRALRDFIRTNFLESNQFLLAVLTYERITSLTVKNIIEKYGELLEMFQ